MNRKNSNLSVIVMVIIAFVAILTSTRLATAQEGEAVAPVALQDTVGTAFTYQGRLTDGGIPANGVYDFGFELQDAPLSGNQIAAIYVQDVQVTDGLFTAELDFGQVFDGTALWLKILVRPGNSTGGYTALAPLQSLTASPYALALPGLWTQPNITSPNVIGGYRGNEVTAGVVGATIFGGGYADHPNQVTASFSTVGGGYDNVVNGTLATVGGGSSNAAGGILATVGGGDNNAASGGSSTVGGGAGNTASSYAATIGGGFTNTASDLYTTISGGVGNTASGICATVGGGDSNNASGDCASVGGGDTNNANGDHATVSGGSYNTASGDHASVGGGYSNTASGDHASVSGGYNNDASTDYAFVGGGVNNDASGLLATVGGGAYNAASGNYPTVGGGYYNNASVTYATVGGGYSNDASGYAATIPGGYNNDATGLYSFAAGRRAQALHDGSFVLADSTDADFFSVRADSLACASTAARPLSSTMTTGCASGAMPVH